MKYTKNQNCDYIYFVDHEEQMVFLVDLNLGGTSLTNYMVLAISSVMTKEANSIENYRIIYRDSEGFWDKVNVFKDGHGFVVGWGISSISEKELNKAIMLAKKS